MPDNSSDSVLVASLLASGEGRTVEFKELFPDLSSAAGKAQLAKIVLALANSAAPSERAFVVFGVTDPARGSRPVGIESCPSAEQVSQLLAAYTSPPPLTSLREVEFGGASLALLTVTGGAAKPHHAVREFQSELNPSLVYVRRDRTIGAATSREVEGMLLQRLGQPGHLVDQNPVRAGFIGRGYDGLKTVLVRVTNVVDETVAGVNVLVDFHHIGLPALIARQGVFANLALTAGESREAEVRVSDLQFVLRTVDPGLTPIVRVAPLRREGSYLGDWWLNAILRVQWRDSEGFARSISSEMALDL